LQATSINAFTSTERNDLKTKLLLVSFDGLRWDYASRRNDLLSFKYLEENGVKAEYMTSAFPTQTSPNHMSIATGRYVESHGVVHNCDYNISSGEVRNTFFTALKNNEWWDNGAEPIWITAVNQGLRSGGILFPGSNSTYSGVGATESILDENDTPNDEEAWRTNIDTTLDWFIEKDYHMIALYFNEPDKSSHKMGPDDPDIAKVTLPLLDRTMSYLFEQIEERGLKDILDTIITSDHGFDLIDTSVKRDDPNAISLSKYVNAEDVSFQFAYGPLGLVQPVPGREQAVVDALRAGNSNSMDVYLKKDLPDRWHYKNNDRVTEVVVTAKPGYSVYSLFTGFHPNTGEHGYDNKFENMRASYYSIGPSFKKNYTQKGFENVHIYPLMCHLLGLEAFPNNGSLSVLKETLADTDGGGSTASSKKGFAKLSLLISAIVTVVAANLM